MQRFESHRTFKSRTEVTSARLRRKYPVGAAHKPEEKKRPWFGGGEEGSGVGAGGERGMHRGSTQHKVVSVCAALEEAQ